MKVAILSESSADEAALRSLIDAVLGTETEPVPLVGLRSRGWPSVRQVLPAVLQHLHYRTDATGLVLVVDSNGTEPHRATHEPPGNPHPHCRLCELRQIATRILAGVRHRPAGPPLRTAFGLAVPAIEAWLRCESDPQVNEAAWINGLVSRRPPYTTARLKQDLYGSDRPSLAQETGAMVRSAKQLTRNLSLLETRFPRGFGPLASALKAW